MRLTVLTVKVVPAGIVAAFKAETVKQAKHVTINPIILFFSMLF
jgi:hypothetical protein